MPLTWPLVDFRADVPHQNGVAALVQSYGRDYYERNKANGLDLLAYGEWQERYGRWIVGALQLKSRRVLDVGCACGSMLRGMVQAGADVEGIDCSEYLIRLGQERWPDVAPRMWPMDAANLYVFPDETYAWLHSCVVAEHWIPEQVPTIFQELLRVVKPGGGFYCAYESDRPMAGGKDPSEEPTHICLMPASWWEDQLREAGWEVVSAEWEAALRGHPESFFNEYEWAWFVARKRRKDEG